MDAEPQELENAYPNELSAADLLETLRRSEVETEAEKSSAARILHDEVGGLLVGAVMDMSWVSQQSGQSDVVKEKLARAIGLLRTAIDIKRKLVEALRPSLLNDVGLCSTMGWHLKASCDAAGIACSQSFPLNEPSLSADFKIGVFRIFQKALHQILSDGAPNKLSLQVEIIEDILHCRIAGHLLESRPASCEAVLVNTPVHYRTRQMGGACQCLQTFDKNQVNVTIPIPREHC